MCGIIGVVNSKESVDTNKFKELVDSMYHRGPDAFGVVHEEKFSFGSRRLKIIDLDKRSDQPMSDYDNNIFITYNGEIYNYLELKEELEEENHLFKTESDTEVILESYKEWGTESLQKLNGMYAFGLYDKEKNDFYLVRDRLGIKPVYYANIDEKFIFCSELKGIINYPGFKKELNLKAVSCFLSYRYCIGKETYFKDVYQLEPGYYIKIKGGKQEIIKYWDIDPTKKKLFLTKKDKRYIKSLLFDSVKRETISDVPLGAYLSGGIDSTTILCAMSQSIKKPVETFTVTFNEKGYDETHYAEIASNHFNAHNTKLLVDSKDTLKSMKELIRFKDQPLGMHNEIAVYLMAKELKKHVTVVLSGEGADEIFSGYGRIFRSPFEYKKLKFINHFPKFVQKKLCDTFGVNEKDLWRDSELSYFVSKYSYFPVQEKYEIYNDEMKKVASYDRHIIELFEENFNQSKRCNPYDRVSYFFEKIHLPGLLLMMDATAMAASVETRVPFVDHRLVELLFQVPARYKVKWKSFGHFISAIFKPVEKFSELDDTTKFILKDIMKDDVPKEIIEREKMVFPVPLNEWFKGEFNEIMKKELLSDDAKIKMIFDQEKLKKWIEEKEKGNDERFGRKMWLILNLEYWLREYF